MDKWAALRNVKAWLKETVLEEGEHYAVFTKKHHLTIRIVDTEGTYRSDKKEKRQGVEYEKCPKCGKKGLHALHGEAISLHIQGLSNVKQVCKYCDYKEKYSTAQR